MSVNVQTWRRTHYILRSGSFILMGFLCMLEKKCDFFHVFMKRWQRNRSCVQIDPPDDSDYPPLLSVEAPRLCVNKNQSLICVCPEVPRVSWSCAVSWRPRSRPQPELYVTSHSGLGVANTAPLKTTRMFWLQHFVLLVKKWCNRKLRWNLEQFTLASFYLSGCVKLYISHGFSSSRSDSFREIL